MGEKLNDDYPALIDIGSCSLYVVHGSFRSGVQKTKWGIDGVMNAMHNLFDESLLKEKYYWVLSFPLPFCGYRWIEDKKVADRALDVWPNIPTYVNETLKKPKSKIP